MSRKRYNAHGSRKFLLVVGITAAFIGFETAAVVYAYSNKDWRPAVDLAPFLVYTAGVYIAGNVGQKFTQRGKNEE